MSVRGSISLLIVSGAGVGGSNDTRGNSFDYTPTPSPPATSTTRMHPTTMFKPRQGYSISMLLISACCLAPPSYEFPYDFSYAY